MKKLLIGLLLMIMMFSIGCSPREEVNNNEWVDVVVAVGEEIPSPEEVGADYVEPKKSETIQGNSWAIFSERWNEVSENIGKPELRLDEVEVRYAKPSAGFEYEITPYLAVYGGMCYEAKELRYTGVDWKVTSDIDGEMIAISWSALIYATNPNMTSDELVDVLAKLGIYELTTDELTDYEEISTIGDLKYDFYSTENWGTFEIYPDN